MAKNKKAKKTPKLKPVVQPEPPKEEVKPEQVARDIIRGKRNWDDVVDLVRKQEWALALKVATRVSAAGRTPTRTEAETMLLYLNATQEELDRPSVPPPAPPPPKKKEEENVWTGGSTMPDAWRLPQRKRQAEFVDPTANPPGQPLPKIKARKGNHVALKINNDWTIKGTITQYDAKEGTLTITWNSKKKHDVLWTFTYWAKMNMDDLIVR